MPSSVPLTNAIAQNSVDFNNQTPTNASGLFRYKINSRGSGYAFTDADLNSVCIFSGGAAINDVSLNIANFSVVPPIGAEIIFYSTTGNIRIAASGAPLYSSVGPFTTGTAVAGKIIYKGNSTWYLASANANNFLYTWTNCCSNEASLYQILVTSGSFYSGKLSYFDSGLTKLYNGTVFSYDSGLYYRIVNGVSVATFADCAATTLTYNTDYTFYDSPDPIYGNSVTLYSVSGLNQASPETLLGHKFFTGSKGTVYDCYTSSVVNNYYTATTAPYYAITFYGGYVTSYTYTPAV